MNLKQIGANIKKLRRKKGLTQAQLAELAEISTVHMSHIETGSVAMSLESLINISNSLDTTPDIILLGEYNIPSEYSDSIFAEKTKDLTADEIRLLIRLSELLETLKINRT